MAQEPYSEGVPNVTPQGAPANDYQRIDPVPGAFGALQGQALKQSGAELDQASQNAAQIATLRQDRYNQIAVQQSQNSLSDLLFAKTYKDPATGAPGIYALKGADALSAFQPTMQAIEEGRQAIREGLQNDAQRLAFDTQSRYYINRERDRIGEHVATQVDAYGVATSGATIDNSIRDISANPLDDNAWQRALQSGYGGVATTVQSKGLAADPAATLDAKSKFEAQAAITRIDAMNGLTPGSGTRWARSASFPDGTPVWGMLPAPEQQRLGTLGRQDNAASVANREYGGLTRSTNTAPIADQTLPPEAQKFLPALSGGEGNYNSPAPTGDTSGAGIGNNRYQFLSRTWQTAAPKAGVDVNDRSPAAQDRTAWSHAQETYKDVTGGRDLQSDIRDGGHEPTIALALNKVWPSLPGGSQQNTSMAQWLTRMRAPPTTGDAPLPLGGTQVLQAEQRIQDSGLPPEDVDLAVGKFRQQVAGYNQALQMNAENALNDLGTRIMKDPLSVQDEAILNDPRLNLQQKVNLRALKQNTIDGKGDGMGYAAGYQMVFAPPGTPGRINTAADLIPLSPGLTAPGMEKLSQMIKLRDAPDGPVMTAAVSAWKTAIEGTTRESPNFVIPPAMRTPAQLSAFARFTADLPGIISDAKSKGMSMAQIVGQGGPVEKVLPNYILSRDQMRAVPGTAPAAAPAIAQPAAPTGAALTVGQAYTRGPGGSFVPAPSNTPNARIYRGGPITGNPGSWEVPAPQAPGAPTDER